MQILKRLVSLWLMVVTGLLSGLANAGNPIQLERLTYEVQEGDRAPLITRIWVSPEMMRKDDGEEGSGYVLFDRRDKTVYSINLEEHTVLIVPLVRMDDQVSQPANLNLRQLKGEQAPEVGGRQPEHWQLRLGEQVCQEGWAVPGLMPESIAAMSEYREALARQHLLTLDQIPEAYRDLCDDVVQVFAPTALLQKGLPLRTWDAKGVVWRLKDYQRVDADPKTLFERPENLEVMTMPGQPMPEPFTEIPDAAPAQ
ncbi:MAG: hypothetical protein ABW068_09880 [Candidatus Thiodiazotropha sp.]